MGIPPNIILVGTMGSGKTSSGKELSILTGFEFIDVDRWIEEKTQKKISQIFEQAGEDFFRTQEREAVRFLASKTGCVFSPGGGAWLDLNSREIMLRNGWCVWLKVSADEAWKRVMPQIAQRPMLSRSSSPRKAMETILNERAPFFSKAHFHIDTDEKSPAQVAKEILEALKKESPFDLSKLQK